MSQISEISKSVEEVEEANDQLAVATGAGYKNGQAHEKLCSH